MQMAAVLCCILELPVTGAGIVLLARARNVVLVVDGGTVRVVGVVGTVGRFVVGSAVGLLAGARIVG